MINLLDPTTAFATGFNNFYETAEVVGGLITLIWILYIAVRAVLDGLMKGD